MLTHSPVDFPNPLREELQMSLLELSNAMSLTAEGI